MSQLTVDLANPNNWREVFDESRSAVPITQTAYDPIAAFEVGILLNTPIIRVRTLSPSAKSRWRFAGTLSQRVSIVNTAFNSTPAVTYSKGLRLNRTEVIRLPWLSSDYELVFEPPYWMRDLRLTIWEYTGVYAEQLEELLDTVKVDLARLETKVDALSS